MVKGVEAPRFVAVGGYVADCIVDTPRLPAWGDDYQVRSVRTSPGGKALNQAVALARLGGRVTAVGAVGKDPLGCDVSTTLTREGVDITGLEVRPQIATPVCLCLVGDDGRTSFLWHIADEAAVSPETVQAAASAIARADAVLLTFEMPVSAIRATIELAYHYGALVVVQPAPVLAFPGDAAALPWSCVDVVVPNAVEAKALLGDSQTEHGEGYLSTESVAKALARDLGVPRVVVTLAEHGCLTYSSGVIRRYPPQHAVSVGDTTGASDAFTAVLVLKLAAAAPESDAIHAALSSAAEAISRPGGYESMPYRTAL